MGTDPLKAKRQINGDGPLKGVRGSVPIYLAAVALLGAAALVAAFLGAGHFLEATAQAPAKADLIFALGGDNGARADRVLEIYRQGLAPKILLGSEGVHSNTRAAYLGWRARYLIDEGIPEQALLYDRRSRSSWDEAVNTLQLMRSMKMNRVLVVSDPPHLRRLSWVLGQGIRRQRQGIHPRCLRHGGLGRRALVAHFAECAVRVWGVHQAGVLPGAVLENGDGPLKQRQGGPSPFFTICRVQTAIRRRGVK